jgi:hypothetical protein
MVHESPVEQATKTGNISPPSDWEGQVLKLSGALALQHKKHLSTNYLMLLMNYCVDVSFLPKF